MFKSLSLTAVALCASGVAAQSNFIGDIMNSLINPGYGKVAAPEGSAPTFVDMPARITNVPGIKTVKVRYGPYKVPAMSKPNILGEGGVLWNYPHQYVQKPCEGDCIIVGMNAGLEYPDGKNANIDTGMWLHHFVLLTEGPGRRDETCQTNGLSLPHFLVGSSSSYSERTFSSGNERTPALMPTWGETEVGYKLRQVDKFDLIVDLMNDNDADKTVFLTITFDILPGKHDNYDDMRPVWFDIAQCLTSDVPPPKEKGFFTISAPVWEPSFEGRAIGAAGHLHDGGLAVTLWKDGQLACNSSATYGGSKEYINAPDAMLEHAGSATVHISKMSICAAGSTMEHRDIKPGQKWVLKASYNYDRHAGALNHEGKQDFIMGISIMYVRVKTNLFPAKPAAATAAPAVAAPAAAAAAAKPATAAKST